LNQLPHEFAGPLLRRTAELPPLASRVLWRAETGSTNADAAALAEAGAAEGAVVVADLQTAGRGRLGRSWSSPPGAGIYASVLLRPEALVARLLPIAAGVAIAEAIEEITGLAPALKWPNDVYLAGGEAHPARKVAGILAESGVSAGDGWVIIGFGINVLPAALPAHLTRATSSCPAGPSVPGSDGRPPRVRARGVARTRSVHIRPACRMGRGGRRHVRCSDRH